MESIPCVTAASEFSTRTAKRSPLKSFENLIPRNIRRDIREAEGMRRAATMATRPPLTLRLNDPHELPCKLQPQDDIVAAK